MTRQFLFLLMARSARLLIDDHIAGGQAKLAAYRKQYSGSGQYIPPSKFGEQDEQLLESLMAARDVLEEACFGLCDPRFISALDRWVAGEWGGYLDRETYTLARQLPRPEKRQLLRGHAA